MSESERTTVEQETSDSEAAEQTGSHVPVTVDVDDATVVSPKVVDVDPDEEMTTVGERTPFAQNVAPVGVAGSIAAGSEPAKVDPVTPVVVKPEVEKPVSAKPVPERPVVEKPVVEKPVPAKPAAARTASSPSRDRTGTVKSSRAGVRPARKARLRIAKLDPWSVMKTALMFSIATAIILFVAVAMLWSVIEASGALGMVQETLNALLGNPDGSGQVQVSAYIDRWRVLGFTAVVCGVNVILLTALATLWAFLYNLTSSVLGGLEVTLAED